MPNSDPRGGIFYLHLTPMQDSYIHLEFYENQTPGYESLKYMWQEPGNTLFLTFRFK